jgi:hypothetical protein
VYGTRASRRYSCTDGIADIGASSLFDHQLGGEAIAIPAIKLAKGAQEGTVSFGDAASAGKPALRFLMTGPRSLPYYPTVFNGG